jgi:hypothetical protein
MGDDLMFPKRRPLKIEPLPGDDNWEAQLIAAMQRIAEDVAEIQRTVHTLVAVLTMHPSDAAPAPDPLVTFDALQPSTWPIGTPVYVRFDDGSVFATKTTSGPWPLFGGQLVISVEGINGAYPFDRVTLRKP